MRWLEMYANIAIDLFALTIPDYMEQQGASHSQPIDKSRCTYLIP